MLSMFSTVSSQIGHSATSLKAKLTQGFVSAVDFVRTEDTDKVIPCKQIQI